MPDIHSAHESPLTAGTGTPRLSALLDAAAHGDGRAWSGLWTELFHNGTLDPAHPLVLPALTAMAEEGTVEALSLAGALLVRDDGCPEPGRLREAYALEVARLLAAAHRSRQAVVGSGTYCVVLEALLGVEGGAPYAEELIGGLLNEEYEIECPGPDGCGEVWVVLGERGHFTTAEDYALAEDDVRRVPLRPAVPGTGPGARLHGYALADGHPDVARALTYVCGEAECPTCGRSFRVSDVLAAPRPR
ncbi:hypothetical protein [Streptomyces sp. NPDC088923]|uniref:hypothetical protein n=1 Tax=Streptomyces sp. NPDC088923 TaxID=3365913 RepID=UPI003808BEBF